MSDENLCQEENTESLEAKYDFLIKFLLLGNSGVGKTCFLHRYIFGEFKSQFVPTVGIDFHLKKLVYEFPEVDNEDSKKKVHLQLWDTAGQERYRSLTKAFFRDGMGFLLLFDLSSEPSFRSVREWLTEIKEQAYCGDPDIILIGNKSDLEPRAVSTAQAKQFAESLNIPYIETSVKTGENVDKAVNTLLDLVVKRMQSYMSSLDAGGPASPAPQVQPSVLETPPTSPKQDDQEKRPSSCPC